MTVTVLTVGIIAAVVGFLMFIGATVVAFMAIMAGAAAEEERAAVERWRRMDGAN